MVVVTPSDWLHKQVALSFLKEYPIKTINNGISLNTFTCIECKTRPGSHIVLNVADGFDERKGIYDIIKLRSILPDNYTIKVVGVSAPHRICQPGIEFIKRTESVEVLVGYYNEAEYYVNPTYEDNFPTTNIEAMACGLPVITYNVGGSPEIVTHECGRIVKCGDVEAMAKIILNEHFDSEDCVARASAYSKDIEFDDYIQLYKS